jgi:hypothetical protein
MEDLIKEIKELKLLAVHGRLSMKVITAAEYEEIMNNIISKCEEIIRGLAQKKDSSIIKE